ncbi:MAG: hypothetical protein HYS63_08365 [Methylocystis sp.]|nr:hypothetical protein [Methylocystis sp.]
MSLTLEKRRKVAELENFEKRIRQEKRRLLSELESLERPFRNAQATGWIGGFFSDIAGGSRAVHDAASSRAPIWFYLVAAIILIGGGLVAHIGLRGAPPERRAAAALESRAAQVAAIAPAIHSSAAAARDSVASSAQRAPGVTALRAHLLEAQATTAPLPEPLPPPAPKADTPAPEPAQAAPVLAPDEAQTNAAAQGVPPVDAVEPATSASAAPAARESRREEKPAGDGRHTQCLVKVDGQILFERGCKLRQPGRSTFTFDAGGDDVVLTLEHGRTWTASLGGRSLGKVYRIGECWGRRREVYICAKGA